MLTFQKEELVNSYFFPAVKAFVLQVNFTESATCVRWLSGSLVCGNNLQTGASASGSRARRQTTVYHPEER